VFVGATPVGTGIGAHATNICKTITIETKASIHLSERGIAISAKNLSR
jgi:hypothetical protein